MNDNFIYSLNAEFNLVDESSPYSISHKIESLYNEYFQPSIEKTIEKYGAEYSLIIDSINIDLGDIEISEIPYRLEKQLESELKKFIIKSSASKISNYNPNESIRKEYKSPSINNSYTKSFDENISDKENEFRLTYDQICDYICHASLPWFIPSSINIIAESKSFINTLLNDNNKIIHFTQSIQKNDVAIFRLINLISKKQLTLYIKKLFSCNRNTLNIDSVNYLYKEIHSLYNSYGFEIHSNPDFHTKIDIQSLYDILSIYDEFDKIHIPFYFVKEIHILLNFIKQYDSSKENLTFILFFLLGSSFHNSFFTSFNEIGNTHSNNGIVNDNHTTNSNDFILTSNNKSTNINFVNTGRHSIEKNSNSLIEDPIDQLAKANINEYSNYTNIQSIENSISNSNRAYHNIHNNNHDFYAKRFLYNPINKNFTLNNTPLNSIDVNYFNTVFLETFNNRIHIEDAGLILLHPFLTNFFQKLNLLSEDKKQFSNTDSQIRAAHLLKYITGYRGPHYEHLMMFEKLICNIPLDYPLNISFIPSKEEKEEIRNLLQTVCQYWKPLNSSSIESLQHSFILRHGTFEWMDPSWIIRVEGSAIDILLDDLPWEISTIILPWLKPMIYVEWQTE